MTQEFTVQSDMYALESIQEAIRAFSDIAEISFNNDVLSITGESSQDVGETFNEFMNYVLSI